MASISEQSVVLMERTRGKLEQKLSDKGVCVTEGEDMNSLVNKVDKIGQNDLLYDFIQGNLTEFALLDKSITTLSSVLPFAQISEIVTKLYIPYINQAQTLFGGNNGTRKASQLLHINATGLVSTMTNYGLAYMPKLTNLVLPQYSSSVPNDSGVLTGNNAMERFIAPKFASSDRLTAITLPNLKIIDIKRGQIGTRCPSLKTIIFRYTGTTVPVLTNSSYLPADVEIYIPQSMIELYQSATNWSAFTDNYISLEGSKYESEDWYKTEDWYLEEMAVWHGYESEVIE